MAAKAKKKPKNPRGSSSGKGKESRIEDVSQASLVFTLGAKGIATNVTDAIEEATLEETMHGASGLKVELLDREYAAIEGGLFDARVRCMLDGAAFRLTQPGLHEDYKLATLFEHALVAEMREHTQPLKARRGKVTRAEFVLMMLRELKQPFVFICPELHRRQKTPKAETTKETVVIKTGKGKTKTVKKKAKVAKGASAGVVTNLADVEKGPGAATVTKSPTRSLTSKGKALTSEQIKIVSQALEAARNTNANRLSMAALVVALIQENDISNPDPGDAGDKGVLSIDEGSGWRKIQDKSGNGSINPYDITEVCEHFTTAGWTGAGGSNALARAHPSWTPAHIGSVVQGPKAPYPESWNTEAFAIVDSFLATGVGGSGGPASAASFTGEGPSEATKTVVKTATLEFSRGQPGQIESTFEACIRLAEEVNWRFFVSGRNEIYFVNDDDLLKAAPRYVIKPDTPGFVRLTFDVEVGGRTVIEKGKRQPKPSEATLVVRADRWAAPPGCVIQLSGWGPADHPWLVDEVTRGLYDSETTIQIRAPQHPLEEPKATAHGSEQSTNEVLGGEGISPATLDGNAAGPEGSAQRIVELARRAVSEKSKYRYSEGGGRGNHGTLFGPAPREMDCSAFVTLVYKEAGLSDPNHQGYSPIGSTASLIPHCRQVKNPKAGDLLFFGSRSYPSHVNLYLGGGKAANMGGPGEPAEGPAVAMGPGGFIGYFRPDVLR